MRKILQYLLKRPLVWLAAHFSAAPERPVVFKSLSDLLAEATKKRSTRLKVLHADTARSKFIIFSDQHKGDKSWADDFKNNEPNYLAALAHYNALHFSLIALGDNEELWKFTTQQVLPANEKSLAAEAAFLPRHFYKTFGNHDIIWKNRIDVLLHLKKYFVRPLNVYEGILIKLKHGDKLLDVFLTHGHQGDVMSDNNRLSTWIIAHIWMPLQRYLHINVNTPSNDFSLRNKHNIMMSEWSDAQQNCILITGHTHVPVFASGLYFNHPSNTIAAHSPIKKPAYFNSGCCCFNDGDITGIEIDEGFIRLIKWFNDGALCKRKVLEEISLNALLADLNLHR